jgi:hypothetical protein
MTHSFCPAVGRDKSPPGCCGCFPSKVPEFSPDAYITTDRLNLHLERFFREKRRLPQGFPHLSTQPDPPVGKPVHETVIPSLGGPTKHYNLFSFPFYY